MSRNLNEGVAEKVMGWHRGTEDDCRDLWFDADENHVHDVEEPYHAMGWCPSEDLYHAWEVVGKMVADGWQVNIRSLIDREFEWDCSFRCGSELGGYCGNSLPEAICQAALTALGHV